MPPADASDILASFDHDVADDGWDNIDDFFRHSSEEVTQLYRKAVEEEDDGEDGDASSPPASFAERTKSFRFRIPDDDAPISASDIHMAEHTRPGAPAITVEASENSSAQKSQMPARPSASRPASGDTSKPAAAKKGQAYVKHFEGTNEIYVNSKMFAALCDSPDATSRSEQKAAPAPSAGLSLPGPRLQPVRNTDESNIFGIISSGILPSVEIDKSFDTPCLEEADLAEPKRRDENKTNEVYITRLSQPQAHSSKDRFFQDCGKSASQNLAGVKSSFNLPKLDHAAKHVSAEESDQVPEESFSRFAIDRLFDARCTELLNTDIGDIGLETDLDRLFDASQSISSASSPRLIYVRSELPFERNRLARAFLTQCSRHIPSCHCYTSAINSTPQRGDLVTALISSRLGCFPDSEENERINCILHGTNELFGESDVRWGRDILLVRYQLLRFVYAKKELSVLASRNQTDLLEVLLSIIEHHAKTGPVIIAISHEWIQHGHAWRDVIRHIQAIESPNILVLALTTPDTDVLPDAVTMDVTPYTQQGIREMMSTALREYRLPDMTLGQLAKKISPSYADIRHALRIIDQILTKNKLIRPDALPDPGPEQLDAFFATYTPDELSFLSVASMLNEYFYFDDIVRVLSLEPMEGEVVWFENKRREWCKTIAAKLVNQGELIPIATSENAPGTCFVMPERQAFRNRISAADPALMRRIFGAYAMVLGHRNACAMQQATAFEEAGLWHKASQSWLNIAQRLMTHFYNQSANAVLRHCLPHIGPQYDIIYKVLLMQCIRQNMRMAKYDLVCEHADMLARYSFMLEDPSSACHAYIARGDALRFIGDYDAAGKSLQYALKLAEKTENETKHADVYHSLAQLALDEGKKGALVNALRSAEKSLEIRRKQGDLPKIGETLTLCAQIYLLRGEPERAKQAANEAFRAFNASGHWYDTPGPLKVIAEAASALEEAMPLENLERALEIAEKTGNVVQQFNLLLTRTRLLVNTLQRQAIRDDLKDMEKMITKWPLLPWVAQYHLVTARFDFSRKNFQKTTKSLKRFFDVATKLGNSYLLSVGYELSANLNFEVYKRDIGRISIEKTNKLYYTATSIYETIGAWHKVAETLRHYADFLDYTNCRDEAEKARIRADKVDPYCQH